MAAIAPTRVDVSPRGDGSAFLVTWTPVTSAGADTCNPVSLPDHPDKSIHSSGNFGGTGVVTLNGSNNGGVSFAALRTPASAAISHSAETINAVLENTVLVQPVLTGGTAASVTIAMLFRMTNPLRT